MAKRQPPPGLVHHCDRGVQYASAQYIAILEKHGMIPSMNRLAIPYDPERLGKGTQLPSPFPPEPISGWEMMYEQLNQPQLCQFETISTEGFSPQYRSVVTTELRPSARLTLRMSRCPRPP